MKLRHLLYFSLLTTISCKKENALDCFKGNGKEKTETRFLEAFTKIKTYDKIEVTIVKGNTYRVDITGGSHLLSNIKTTINDGTLTIKNKNTCNFVRGYKKKILMTITLPYLDIIENLGVGAVYFDPNFTQDTLKVRSQNSGDTYIDGNYYKISTSSHGDGNMYLNGTCNTLYVYMFGTNFLYGNNLTITNYTFMENISLGSIYINAPDNGTLECNIRSEGNIYYTGNPATITNYSNGKAKGTLIKN